jgi:hypothetical protein
MQNVTSLPTAVYYGDESDEGLVRIFPSDIKITKLFLQDSMSSVDTTRAPYDSDDQDGKNLFF